MENPSRILELCLKKIGIFCALETLKAKGITDEYMKKDSPNIALIIDGQLGKEMIEQICKEFQRLSRVEEAIMKVMGEELKLSGLNVAEEIFYFESLEISTGHFEPDSSFKLSDRRSPLQNYLKWIRSQIERGAKKAANVNNHQPVERVWTNKDLADLVLATKIQIDEMKRDFEGFKREVKEKLGLPNAANSRGDIAKAKDPQ